MIWGFIGPEGGGKTTAMTAIGLMHIARGGTVQTFPGYEIHDTSGKTLTTEINLHEWLSMPQEHRNVMFCADEIQNFLDSKLHSSVFARLVGRVGMQRRKLNMGILYTVQNWQWLNDRMRWLTHLLTNCYDLYWTPWGKDQGIKRGEVLRLTTFDCKGFYTGKPWSLFSQKILNGRKLWPYFESYMAVDIYEGEKKFEVKRQSYIVDLRPPKEDNGEVIEATEPGFDIEKDRGLLENLADSGVSAKTINDLARRLQQ